ncbi:putative Amidoligase enzyme [Seiridium unicorne]|uniref:Amidoligase enzyme n=1 Tax=Seiridium unicorne TaxID=138068 RepID=A0ABR2V4R2_9PEZI
MDFRFSFSVKLRVLVAALPVGAIDSHADDGLVPIRIRPGINIDGFTQAQLQIHDETLESDNELDKNYSWIGIQITSPVFVAQGEDWDGVDILVRLIKDRFRVVATPACTYEVRVGMGEHLHYPFPDHVVEQMAQFLWTAEPTLSRLHDPRRRAARQKHALRKGSRMANGWTNEHADFWFRHDCWLTEKTPEWRRIEKMTGQRHVQQMYARRCDVNVPLTAFNVGSLAQATKLDHGDGGYSTKCVDSPPEEYDEVEDDMSVPMTQAMIAAWINRVETPELSTATAGRRVLPENDKLTRSTTAPQDPDQSLENALHNTSKGIAKRPQSGKGRLNLDPLARHTPQSEFASQPLSIVSAAASDESARF